jgi:hypothetical protein
MTIYIIRTNKNPTIYYHSTSNNRNSINTATRFTKDERNFNKLSVRNCGYEYLKFDENGKLVIVPLEAEE